MMNLKKCSGMLILLFVVFVLAAPIHAQVADSPAAKGEARAAFIQCTFTTAYNKVNLRSGPGTENSIVGKLTAGESIKVTGETTGKDGYIWWQVGSSAWVRSDLGSSDCPAVCGNKVCEYGETASSCAQDCSSTATCVFQSCEQCIAAFPCWPQACTVTQCTLNDYGCPVCKTAR
jgi:SH3-like domain-containing protein